MQQQPQMRGKNIFVKEIRARIDAVFKITIRTVRETIPKLIGYFLVRMSQDKLQAELYQKINENESILDSLGEPKHIQERRRTLQEIIKTLKESLKVLQRDPDITAASTIDDSELSELLRQDADQQRQQRAARVGAPMANNAAAASGQIRQPAPIGQQQQRPMGQPMGQP